MHSSLPALIKLTDYGNDFEKYLEALYQIYLNEVVNAGIKFRGLPVRVQFRPMNQGKGFGFWHLISEGKIEEERIPNLRRCERIRWITWVICNADSSSEVLCWENKRNRDRHTVLWFQRENFVVILAKRHGYYLLKTAYIADPHRKKSFESELEQYRRKG